MGALNGQGLPTGQNVGIYIKMFKKCVYKHTDTTENISVPHAGGNKLRKERETFILSSVSSENTILLT